MISRWLLKLVIGIALVGLVAFELGSPLVTKAILDGQAHDAANDAAHEYFQSHDTDKAQQAASQDAAGDHAKLTRFAVDDQGVVRVTLSKEAKSYVLHRIDQMKSWYDVTASASAVPK